MNNKELIPGVSSELITKKENDDNVVFGDVTERVKELMKNNIKLPFAKKEEKKRDKEHLEFIYARLLHVYHENENFDYMIKLKKIIDGYDR